MYLIQNLSTGAYARKIGTRWGWTFDEANATKIRGFTEANLIVRSHFPNDDTEYLSIPEPAKA